MKKDLAKEYLFKNMRYFWIYITGKCGLNCDYCFFRDKDGKSTISFGVIENLARSLRASNLVRFVISGGEPLLEWDLVTKTVAFLRKKFDNSIIIQTNGLRLRPAMVDFLKKNNTIVELGVDGPMITMQRHRKGMDERRYKKLIDSVNLLLKEKVKICVTMTVHQKEAGVMFDNFLFLVSLGLYDIDISPAIFTKWTTQDFLRFKREYIKIANYVLKERKLFTLDLEYDKPVDRLLLDLCILPTGEVFPNWVFLSLPRDLGEEYTIMKVNEGRAEITDNLRFILKYYTKNVGFNFTYRDYNLLNAKLIYKYIKPKLSSSNFNNYVRVCKFLKRVNQRLLSINKLPNYIR